MNSCGEMKRFNVFTLLICYFSNYNFREYSFLTCVGVAVYKGVTVYNGYKQGTCLLHLKGEYLSPWHKSLII